MEALVAYFQISYGGKINVICKIQVKGQIRSETDFILVQAMLCKGAT